MICLMDGQRWATCRSVSVIGATPKIAVAPTADNCRAISSEENNYINLGYYKYNAK